MIAVCCALLSAVAFYFSSGLGRMVAAAPTVGGFTTVVGELPLDGRGGATLYDRIGDLFGWLCLLLGLGLVGASCARKLPRTRARPLPQGNAASSHLS